MKTLKSIQNSNLFKKLELRARRAQHLLPLQDIPFWVSAFVVGIVAAAYSGLFEIAEHLLVEAYKVHVGWVYILSPICLVASWYLARTLAPQSQGSGIPQVLFCLDAIPKNEKKELVEEALSLRTILVKVVGSVLAVLGGGAVGREGPTVQISAAILYQVRQRLSKRFRISQSPEVWLVTGGAAGIAAAFNTPLGGLVYAIEELASTHINRFKTSLITAVIIAGLASQWLGGSYLYLGFPRIDSTGWSVVGIAMFVGVMGGILGAGFGRILVEVRKLRLKFETIWGKAFLAVLCGLILAWLAHWFGMDAVGPGRSSLMRMLFEKEHETGVGLSLARFFAPIVTYASGVPGGIFAPSLAAGGSLGSLFAESFGILGENLFILLGMIGFLTGVTRTPFTAFVLVLEMTDRHSAIFPMMLTALMASGAAKLVDNKSFYHRASQLLWGVNPRPQ